MFLGSQGAPKWAPNGPQIAFRTSFGLEIYGHLVREGSERAPRQKKISSAARDPNSSLLIHWLKLTDTLIPIHWLRLADSASLIHSFRFIAS